MTTTPATTRTTTTGTATTRTATTAPARPGGPPGGAPAPRTRLRLQVDWTLCEARGHCVELLPETLAEDPWGYPMARSGAAAGRGFPVPDHLEAHARRAVSSCPRLALVLDEN